MSIVLPIFLGLSGGSAMLAAAVSAGRIGRRRHEPEMPTPRALLKRALGRHEVEIHYQPVFLGDGSLVGAEALVRWRHPSSGLIGPGAFLRGVESGVEIDALTTLVLADACRTLARLRRRLGVVSYLGVNIPAAILEHERLPQLVEAQLRAAKTDGQGLVLELTETSRVKDWDAVRAAMSHLRRFGVRLALDDFGQGHANLPALGTSHADIVKLDKSLIDQVLVNSRSSEIAESVVQLAGSLNMEVVAEGIEDPEVLDWLRQREITFFQGYALGCPQPADELISGAFRAVPIPTLGGPPRVERGSIVLQSTVLLALVAGALGTSARSYLEWTDLRSPTRQAAVAFDDLERSYLTVVGLARRSATSDVATGNPTGASASDDLIAIKGLDLLNAIDKTIASDPTSAQMIELSNIGAGARTKIAQTQWTEAAEQVMTQVVPGVKRYLDERSATDPGRAAEELVDLLYERVVALEVTRAAFGLDVVDEAVMATTRLPSGDLADPITTRLDAGRLSGDIPDDLADALDGHLDSISATWPLLINPTFEGIASIDPNQVLTDALSAQLALQEQIDRHQLPGWQERRISAFEAPNWTWLAAALVAPVIGAIASFTWAVGAPQRGRRRRAFQP